MSFDINGIGGQVRPTEASEAMAQIAQNRTMLVQQLTTDPAVKPETVEGLKTVDEVFEHFKPKIEIDFEAEDGTEKTEEIHFHNVGDFGKKGITKQSAFLQDLQLQQDNYQQFIKFLRSNKVLQKMLADAESKEAYIGALQSLIQELEAVEVE